MAALPIDAATNTADSTNPFHSIVASNIFRLRPIPPQTEPKPEESEPVTMLAKVVLKGIHTVFGRPQALLEVTESERGKHPNTQTPILHEGQRQGSVQVLSIDVEKNLVRIRNSAVETNLTFDPLTQSASAAVAVTTPPPLPAPGRSVPAANLRPNPRPEAGNGG